MNFKAAISKINKDYCNTLFAEYMKGEWGITVGFRTVDLDIVRMRKKLADYQNTYDCQKILCTQSKTQPFTISKVAVAIVAGECVLNPPLFAYNSCSEHWKNSFNTNELIIRTFN